LQSLYEWSQQAVKQEQEDHSKSCENNKESIKDLDRTTATLRRKIKDIESPTKRKLGISADIDEEIRRHRTPPPLRQGRGIGGIIPPPPPPTPPPQDGPVTQVTQVTPAPPVKKEPRNLQHPPKLDGTSLKFEEFMQKVDNIFKRMPLSYSTISEKIVYVLDLLTGRADVWYRANQHKRLLNEKTKWLECGSYGRFNNELMEAHRNHHEQREAKQTMLKDYQRKDERMVDYISRNRVHQLIACLSREALWEHLVNSIQPEVRTHMIRTSMNKDVLDKVPASIEMCFHTIANARSTLEYERGREKYTSTRFRHKVDRAGGTKEMKEPHKSSEATKKDDNKGMQKKKAKPKSQGTSAKSDKSDTTKKAKEPGEELVTYAMEKARMASSQCIKCGDPNHIKKDCTNAWKPTKEEKKKADKGKEKAAKVSAITATVDVVPEPISYGRIISKDELDFEGDELDTQ